MSRTILIECSPRRASDGAVVPLRLVSKSIARANFFGVQWHPAVVSVPAFESSLGFDGRTFGVAPSPQIGELVFALTQATRFAGALVWTNAAVTMKMALWPAGGGDAADGAFATIWSGLAEDIAAANGQARVRLLDNGQALRVPTLAAKFGSSGDALLDGADALKDRSAETRIPRAWGKLLSIPALLVDRANNIWLFAGNAASSVQGFYDGGAAFAMGTARASFAALQASVPTAGAVDYCLDAGGKFLARPWTTPVYPFTAAATFGSAKPADIAAAIVTGRTAVTMASGTVAAFNAMQGADCGLYLDDDTTVASALDEIFVGLGAWWRLSSGGTITLGRWGWGSPVLTVPAHRRHAPERLRVLAPTRRRSLGYARNNRVHSESEIARILLAGDLAYADGTSIEALKPAAAGADVTGSNTAAAIAGQGALATQNAVNWATQIIGAAKVAGNLLPDPITLSGLWFPDSNASLQVNSSGGRLADRYRVYMTANTYFSWVLSTETTRIPVSTGQTVFYQHAVFTTNTVGSTRGLFNAYDATGAYLGTYEFTGSSVPASTSYGTWTIAKGQVVIPAGVAYIWPHAAGVGLTSGAYFGEPFVGYHAAGADITAINTAAAIAGQGALATQNAATWATQVTGTGKPTDNADVTAANTAAAIAGQGALATKNTVSWATDITGTPSGFGQMTVGNGQSIQKWMTNGDTIAVSGGHGGTTGTYGLRSATLLANGSVFATGSSYLVAPSEPGSGEVSGTYTHSGASALVSFTAGYSGTAYTVDTAKIFCRA